MERYPEDEAEPVSIPQWFIPEVGRHYDSEDYGEKTKEVVVPGLFW